MIPPSKIIWEEEERKIFSGDAFQCGSASMVRAMKCALDSMKVEIQHGADPLKRIDATVDWLAASLYSCNMNNFRPTIQEAHHY